MKTPEEIKKGLLCCCHDADCDICPYVESGCGNNELKADAFAYIQQLENNLQYTFDAAEVLRAEGEKFERQRDAALYDMHNLQGAICAYCKNLYRPDGADHAECREFGDLSKHGYGEEGAPLICGKFAWRGVCPENTEVQE